MYAERLVRGLYVSWMNLWKAIVQRLRPRCKSRGSSMWNKSWGLSRQDRRKPLLEMTEKGMEGLRLERRNANSMVAMAQQFGLFLRNAIALVEDQDFGDVLKAQLCQYRIDGFNMCIDVSGPGIDHVHQQVRLAQFLQSRSERPDEFLRKIPDETDGVRNDHLSILWESEPPAGRIERFKDSVFCRDTALGKDVQEGRFSGICVPDERDNRQAIPCTAGAALVLVTGKLVQLSLQMCDAVSDPSSVCF